LLVALRIAEDRHIDNTGEPCSVRSYRDDCCQYCAAALHIREAINELHVGFRVEWRDGRTVMIMESS
jgi:hypothetical protein